MKPPARSSSQLRYPNPRSASLIKLSSPPDAHRLIHSFSGQSIEPSCYVPVIPMALVNGSDGIGTGEPQINGHNVSGTYSNKVDAMCTCLDRYNHQLLALTETIRLFISLLSIYQDGPPRCPLTTPARSSPTCA